MVLSASKSITMRPRSFAICFKINVVKTTLLYKNKVLNFKNILRKLIQTIEASSGVVFNIQNHLPLKENINHTITTNVIIK